MSGKGLGAHRVARLALLLAAALILSWVEAILPFQIPVPGVKLGLANIVLLYVLYRDPAPVALCFGVLRVLLSGVFLGRLSGVFFSLCGMLAAFCVMVLLKRFRCFSSLGVSVSGAIFHGIGQLFAASLLLTPAVWSLLPLVALSSAACGAVTWVPLRILGRYGVLEPQKTRENLNKD